jgi:hypothetical protein
MKKTFIIIGFGLLNFSITDAQILKNVGMNIGYVYAIPKWSYTLQTGLWPPLAEPISTFTGGVFAESYDVKNFSIFTKLQYVGKGRSFSAMVTRQDNSAQGYVDLGYQTFKERLDYICIPVLLKYSIPLPSVEPFIALGPRLEFLVQHPSSVTYNKFKKTEWAETLSAGAEVSIKSLPKFIIETEYNMSLTDSYHGEFLTVNDHSVEILIGVIF